MQWNRMNKLEEYLTEPMENGGVTYQGWGIDNVIEGSRWQGCKNWRIMDDDRNEWQRAHLGL